MDHVTMLTIQEQLSKLYYTWVNEIKGRFNQGLMELSVDH